MYMDPEFKCLDKLIVGTDLNKTAARYHVPEIKRQIQVVKEQMQAVHGGIPHDCMTSLMIIDLGKYTVMMINASPPKSCLSRTYIPRTTMKGKQLNFKNQCRCPFGAYVQAHDNRNVTNLMVDWTQGDICLGPT